MPANIKEVTINKERGLYVIPCGEGYSCWGFQNAWDRLTTMLKLFPRAEGAEELRSLMETSKDTLFGTMRIYNEDLRFVEEYGRSNRSKDTWFDPQTPLKVCNVLERARKTGLTIRIWLGDAETGRSWMEECDTVGKVGRSGGILKTPLLVQLGADGGPAISTSAIIRIRHTGDRGKFKDLYRHPKFHVPRLTIEENPLSKEYPFQTVGPDGVHSGHKTYAEAAGLIAWLAGEEYVPPTHDDE